MIQKSLKKSLKKSLNFATLSLLLMGLSIGCGEDEAAESNTATLSGTVILSAMLEEDTEGTLYIALFETDPAADLANPPPEVDSLIIEMADFSDPETSFSFEFSGLPLRDEPYYATALLDLNENAAETSLPDKGDIITLVGQGSPSVLVNQASVDMTLDLNFVFPF